MNAWKKILCQYKPGDIDSWSRFLQPLPFFFGIVIGFFACCAAGSVCTGISTFDELSRFDLYVCPYTNYYPTANQMVNFIEKHARPDQIIVIVGGNSVFKGFGQKPNDLWTEKLRNILGDHYFIVNYAFEGTAPFEGGYWTAEALTKRGKKVIYVTNAESTKVGGPVGFNLASMFFDYRSHDMMLPFKERDDYLTTLGRNELNAFRDRVLELNLSKTIDRLTNSSDLWNYVSYHYFNTMWTGYTKTVFPPRKSYGYAAPFHSIMDEETCKAFRQGLIDNNQHFAEQDKNGQWVPTLAGWYTQEFDMKVLTAPEMRDHCIIFITCINPKLIDSLTKIEKERHLALYKISQKVWAKKWLQHGCRGQ